MFSPYSQNMFKKSLENSKYWYFEHTMNSWKLHIFKFYESLLITRVVISVVDDSHTARTVQVYLLRSYLLIIVKVFWLRFRRHLRGEATRTLLHRVVNFETANISVYCRRDGDLCRSEWCHTHRQKLLLPWGDLR